MRIIVFFDLPVKTLKEKKEYSQFRKALLKDGFYMIQYSVYGRICNGVDAVDKHIDRVLKIAPREGSIRLLSITEKQYASIKIIVGEKKFQDKDVSNVQLSFF